MQSEQLLTELREIANDNTIKMHGLLEKVHYYLKKNGPKGVHPDALKLFQVVKEVYSQFFTIRNTLDFVLSIEGEIPEGMMGIETFIRNHQDWLDKHTEILNKLTGKQIWTPLG